MEELQRVTALIREKKVPVVSRGLLKPTAVKDRVQVCLPFEFNMDTHTKSWKHYRVRPPTDSERPEITKPEFCIYDELPEGYGYTDAWVKFLCRKLADPVEYEVVTGRKPVASPLGTGAPL